MRREPVEGRDGTARNAELQSTVRTHTDAGPYTRARHQKQEGEAAGRDGIGLCRQTPARKLGIDSEVEFGFSYLMPSQALRANSARSSKAERTAAAIKDAARRVIARDGYVNSRIVDIAQEAGKGIGTFYAYFDSKETLLAALAEDFRIALAARIQLPREAGDHPVAHFQETIRAFWETYQQHRPAAVAVFQMAMHDERFAAIWRNIRKGGMRVSATRIQRAQQLGLCPGLDPERAATALCSMIEFACFEWSGGLGGPRVEEAESETVVATLTRLMTHAIGWREDLTALRDSPAR